MFVLALMARLISVETEQLEISRQEYYWEQEY